MMELHEKYTCPHCNNPINFKEIETTLDYYVDEEGNKSFIESFECPCCGILLSQ